MFESILLVLGTSLILGLLTVCKRIPDSAGCA
jgi:hypothetical protein